MGISALACVVAAAAMAVRTSDAVGIDSIAPIVNISDLPGDVDLSKPDARCGQVLYFDFGSPHDGPAYYTDTQGKILARCGGLLRATRAVDVDKSMYICPAEQWSCAAPNIDAIMQRKQHNSTTNRQN